MRASVLRRGEPWLAALIVVVAALLWTQGMRGNAWSPDEEYFVQLARVLADHFPGGLWDVPAVEDYNDRGIQRLLPLLLAWPLGSVGAETGFGIARAMLALAWASAAVPAYLLARGVRLSVAWALVAAALTIIVPWAVLSGGMLTEPLAYPLSLWALWAAWRACLVPGVASDLLALGLVAAATLARTGCIVLLAVAPVVVALWTLSAERRPGPAARRMLREHPLLAVGLALGALVVALGLAGAGLLEPLFGSYNTQIASLDWSPVPGRLARESARIVTGVGIVPAVLGVAWIAWHAVRRRSAETQALALTCAVALPLLLVATMYSSTEERYLIYAAPLLVVPGVVALARRDVPAWGVAVSGLVLGVLVWRVAWPFVSDAALLQTDAARSFLTRIVLIRLESLPGPPQLVVGVATVVAGGLLALLVGARFGGRAAAGVAAVLLGVQVFQTAYVVEKRAEFTAGPADLAGRVWLDRLAGEEEVAAQAEGLARTTGFEAAWREVEFFNARVRARVTSAGDVEGIYPRYASVRRVRIDPRTGAITARDGDALPRLWAISGLFRPVVMAGERELGRASYLPVRLVAVDLPPRALWRWTGIDVEGFMGQGAPGTLEVFPAAVRGLRRPCVRLTLLGPPNYVGVHRYRVRSGDVRRVGTLRAEQRAVVDVPLRRRVTLDARGEVQIFGGRMVALQLADTQVVECSRRQAS